MNADGIDPANLTNHAAGNGAPSWSPDGTKIAFSSERDGGQDVFVMNADGTDPVNLTNNGRGNSWPVWSPYLGLEPTTHRFDYVLPAGLRLFAPTLRINKLLTDTIDVDVAAEGGILRARHLLRIGSTIVVQLEEGTFRTAIGADGALISGADFPIEAGSAYAINMLEPLAVTAEGASHGVSLDSATAPSASPGGQWAYAIGGHIADASLLPDGVEVRVTNARTGEFLTMPLYGDGRFAAAFVDQSRHEVVAREDILDVELVAPGGYTLNRRWQHRINRDDLLRAHSWMRLSARPIEVRLLPNFPNPFNPETWIPFELSDESEVVLRVYSVAGELVRVLDLGHQAAGYHVSRAEAAYWDGQNESRESVASGAYIAELEAWDLRDARRIVVQK